MTEKRGRGRPPGSSSPPDLYSELSKELAANLKLSRRCRSILTRLLSHLESRVMANETSPEDIQILANLIQTIGRVVDYQAKALRPEKSTDGEIDLF